MALERKSSKKKAAQVTVVHRIHGEGQLIERRDSPSGNVMLGVRFPDGTTRLLLAAPEFWFDASGPRRDPGGEEDRTGRAGNRWRW
jgi:hypothetical protein